MNGNGQNNNEDLLVRNLLLTGKVKQAEGIIKDNLGRKKTEALILEINKYFTEVKSAPLKSAAFFKEVTGTKFYQFPTSEILDVP
jgi:hypothetical protein